MNASRNMSKTLLSADDSDQNKNEIERAIQHWLDTNKLFTGNKFKRKSSFKSNEEQTMLAE